MFTTGARFGKRCPMAIVKPMARPAWDNINAATQLFAWQKLDRLMLNLEETIDPGRITAR